MDDEEGRLIQDSTRSHLILPEPVTEWLAESVVKTVTDHRTSALAADSIREHGVDIERSEHGSFGLGFYTATRVDEFFGDTNLTVAVRARNPLIGSLDEVGRFVDDLSLRLRPRAQGRMTRDAAAAVRLELLDLGYDGVVVFDGGGDGIDFVIALGAESVKVVLQP